MDAEPWPFLSRYAQVLLCIAQNPSLRMREVSAMLGITERSVQKIVLRLEQSGHLERTKDGRLNRYILNLETPLGSPFEEAFPLKELIEKLVACRR